MYSYLDFICPATQAVSLYVQLLGLLKSVQLPGLFRKCPATWTVSGYLDGVHNDVHVEVEGGHGHQVNHQIEGGEEQLRGRPPTVQINTSSGKA
jgi:hypothetical protein